MRRKLVRHVLFLGLIFLLTGASIAFVRLVPAHAEMRATLDTQMLPLLRQAQRLHPTNGEQILDLSIGLRLRKTEQARARVRELADPRSSGYHRYLTPAQFKAAFAPTVSQVQQVQAYLQSQGLRVTGVAANNLLINASGTIAQVQQSFQTQINTYQLKNHIFYANANPPSMPLAISQLVDSIGGLDNGLQYYPHYRRSEVNYRPRANKIDAQPVGLSPKDLASAYDVTPFYTNGMQGQQQNIALFEVDGYQRSDVLHYFHNYALPTPNIKDIRVGNATGSAGQGALEVALDIEMAGSIAPQSNIFVYEGVGTTQGINDLYTQIVDENRAQIVSLSWGLCEDSLGEAEVRTLNTIFTQGALEGISFLAAAGDAGAYDCHDSNLAVDSPASDPNVTGVGGTALRLNADGSYASESVWTNPHNMLHGPMGAGSGGGLSKFFKRPSWQNGPGVQNSSSNGNRQVPDVAAFGDMDVGFSLYCTVKNAGCPAGGWTKIGGTSVAAPFWAASLLLVNQYLLTQKQNSLGSLNAQLYGLVNTPQFYPPFHDITAGDNLYYPATPGYDLASGLGSPDVYNIARDLTIFHGE